MKMAKASAADMEMAKDLCGALDALGHRLVPTMPEAIETLVDGHDGEGFDRDDDAQCGRALRHLLDVADRGSLSRVIWGMSVLLDPANKVVDPSADTLEHHPETISALAAARCGTGTAAKKFWPPQQATRPPGAMELVAEAMQFASTPSSTFSAPRYVDLLDFREPARSEATPIENLCTAANLVIAADRLRSQAQRQLARALRVLATAENLNLARLRQANGQLRAPRIVLWAEVTQVGTLQVFWKPRRDDLAVRAGGGPTEGTDYVRLEPLWLENGVRENIVLRLRDTAHVSRQASDDDRSFSITKSAANTLRCALVESLANILDVIGWYCQVELAEWPEYDALGNLQIHSAEHRACAALVAKREHLAKMMERLRIEVEQKVRRLKLSSATEFEGAVVAADAQGKKLTAVLFAQTGERCTSLQTDSLASRLADLRDLEGQFSRVDDAILHLRERRVVSEQVSVLQSRPLLRLPGPADEHPALLKSWSDGPPAVRDDGGLVIVELAANAKVDGQDHFGLPIIASRWSSKLKTTGGAHRIEYEHVVRHIDIAA